MKYDVGMKVKLCREHMKYYKKFVEFKMIKGGKAIDPTQLITLWNLAEHCTKCQWHTQLPHEDKREAELKRRCIDHGGCIEFCKPEGPEPPTPEPETKKRRK